jgi:hypothetical protein
MNYLCHYCVIAINNYFLRTEMYSAQNSNTFDCQRKHYYVLLLSLLFSLLIIFYYFRTKMYNAPNSKQIIADYNEL